VCEYSNVAGTLNCFSVDSYDRWSLF